MTDRLAHKRIDSLFAKYFDHEKRLKMIEQQLTDLSEAFNTIREEIIRLTKHE
jgi:hypothetical protein